MRIVLLKIVLILCLWTNTMQAQEDIHKGDTDLKANSVANLTKTSDTNKKYKKQLNGLSESIEITIKEEKKQLTELKEKLDKILKDHILEEQLFNAYKIKLSSNINLLTLEKTKIKELEQINLESGLIIDDIDDRINTINSQLSSNSQLYSETSGRHAANTKQLPEIKTKQKNYGMTIPEILVENLETCTLLLEEKLEILKKISSIYKEQLKKYSKVKESFVDFKNKCSIHIDEKQTQALFERKSNFHELLGLKILLSESLILFAKFKMFFKGNFWVELFNKLWTTYGIFMFTSLAVVLFILAIFYKSKHLMLKIVSKFSDSRNYFISHFTLCLFERSVILSGVTLFFLVLSNLKFSQIFIVVLISDILILFLFSQWIMDAIQIWQEKCNKEKEVVIPEIIIKNIPLFVFLFRFSIFFYMIINKGLEGSTGQLLLLSRILFEASLFVFFVFFWKAFFRENENILSKNRMHLMLFKVSAISTNSIVCISLLMELSGFAQLAVYWQISWARTIIVFLWSGLFFLMIKEWNSYSLTKDNNIEDQKYYTKKTIKWTLIRISFLFCSGAFIIVCLFAWGVNLKTIINLIKILNHPIPIGGMKICLPGFIYSFLILVLTHMSVKIWQNTILKKMLADSGMATGIKDTVSTITSYSFWVFGIILALNAVGISTTSLTVAFGALGIGLGFGLQNIFNNFISGMILLFERPIQVGDWVEINGIWGIVKKINVRSTIVQSVDNASLIIPNSDFISNQVINWSYKDLKIRAVINIGVAYSSDLEKVKEILLGIAKENQNVYKSPKVDVIFDDFGDNAILLKLRFWVHVEKRVSTKSKICFEIERLFRENNISIPFPQRDVYVYEK